MTVKQITILGRGLLVLYLGALAYLCFGRIEAIPDLPNTIFGIPLDKVVHFLMFMPFPVIVYMAFGINCRKVSTLLIFMFYTFFAGCILAILTEIGQGALTSYRSPDLMDLKADALSLAAVCLLLVAWHLIRRTKKHNP